MSRQVKSHVARSVSPSEQGITASAFPIPSVPVLDNPTRQDDELPGAAPLLSVRHRTKPAAKSAERTLMISQPVLASSGANSSSNPPPPVVTKSAWTQIQQKQLESALSQVPKSASDRWDRIAELVPDKTKVFLITFHCFAYMQLLE